MIQAIPPIKTPALPIASRGVPSTRRFALSFAAARSDDDGADPSEDDAKTSATDGNGRQDDADDGTKLPNDGATIDPRLAWMTLPLPAPAPTAPVTAAAASGPTGPVGASSADAPAIPAGAGQEVAPPPPVEVAAAPPVTGNAPGPIAANDVPAGSTPTAEVPAPAVKDAATSAALPLTIARPDPSQPAVATPAIQVFATAMRAGMKSDAADKGRKADPDPLAVTGASMLALDTVRHAVAATGAAQEQTLDMHRQNWPSTMIDHIEALRDSADATSSRIRVVPDALGAIDLSVKRDGDTLHVRFDAAQAATRTLLLDAQPRLAEIAQSRGLRLGDANVGGDGSGAQQRTPARPAPIAPIPASTRATIVAAENDDIRIG